MTANLADLRARATRALQGLLDDKEPRREVIPALTGDVEGTVEVPGKKSFMYVRPFHLNGDRMEAYNGGRVRAVAGVPCLVEILFRKGQSPTARVIDRDYYDSPTWDEGDLPFYVAKHGPTHEARPGAGDDVTNVYKRAVTELRADQQPTPDMTVRVQAGLWYYGDTPMEWGAGDSPTFTAPASGLYRRDLLYFANTGALAIKQGTITAGDPYFALLPSPDPDTLPVAYVLLHSSTAAITDDLITDARQLTDQVMSSQVADHPLDPDTGPHTDTLPEDEVVFDDSAGHDHQGSGDTGKQVDHGNTIGKGDDDHTQYLLTTGTRAGATSQAQDFGANGVEADVVAESTADAGVTVDGVQLKDNEVKTSGAVTFAALANNAKGFVVLDDATNGTSTTSTSYVDMAGSSLSVAIPSGQTADVFLVAAINAENDTADARTWIRIENYTDVTYGTAKATSGAVAGEVYSLVAFMVDTGITGTKEYRIEWKTETSESWAWSPELIAVVIPT